MDRDEESVETFIKRYIEEVDQEKFCEETRAGRSNITLIAGIVYGSIISHARAEAGEELSEPVTIDGWHDVDLLLALMDCKELLSAKEGKMFKEFVRDLMQRVNLLEYQVMTRSVN